ncbi:hypothetical protein R1sor_015593 [Riccia sorocarpa]|uniref:Uncharacterized protein n=1 Tax=Riccia sorocarpa TaxID=122646 RepID=A0ABD3HIT9_9MARC
MDRGDESPIAARSEAEELEVQDMEQDADPDAHLGDEVEVASDDEDGLEPSDMQHMVIHEHRTEHNGAWCIEVDKIVYPHIGNSFFKVKKEMTLFLKANDKWSPEGVAAFISEFSDDKDLCAVYCEDWKEKSITQYVLQSSKYDVRGMFRSQNVEFSGVSAKSLKFSMKKTASWVRKKLLFSRFWDARSHMYNTGRIASQIVTCAFVVPRPRRIDADDVFEYLTKFEEEKRSGKRKTTTPRTGNNKKKPRPVEAIADLLPFSQKDSSPIVLETYAKTHKLKWSEDVTLVFVPSLVECLNQAKAQWITLRRPKSTQGSTTKNDPFDQFKSIVCQTMGRRSHKEVIPLVCCSDETYAAFEKFMKRWKEGKIPDVQGTIGPSKDPRTGLVCDRDVSII